MDISWIGKMLVPISVGLAFAAFRKYFPPNVDQTLDQYDRSEGKRLPTGVFSTVAITMGAAIAVGGYFGLRAMNQLFAKFDGPALVQVLPVKATWWFLPGFAAIAIPWPLLIAVIRRSSYSDEAKYIEAESALKSGFDAYRILRGMILFIVLPIAIFTVLALPERLTLTDNSILWTHYASLKPEVFNYTDAVRLTTVDGYELRDGSFKAHKDLLIDFKDGRQLSANAVGDGSSEPTPEEIKVIVDKTGLVPQKVRTKDEIRR